MPLVSVIIPTYNRAHLVGDAIESVLSQSFTDLELIVVDDGSIDGTDKVISAFSDARVRCFSQEHGGVAAARNLGIELAFGKLTAFLDSDDLFLPGKLSIQVERLREKPRVGLVYGWFYKRKGNYSGNSRLVKPKQVRDLGDVLLGTSIAWPTVLVHTTWLRNVGGFDQSLRVSEDWDMIVRLALQGCQMEGVEEPLALVRPQTASITSEWTDYSTAGKRIVDRAFADPRMPLEFQKLKSLANAVYLVSVAGSAYIGGRPDVGRSILVKAVHFEETWTSESMKVITDKLFNYLSGNSKSDLTAEIKTVETSFGREGDAIRRIGHLRWRHHAFQEAFLAYRMGDRSRCWRYAAKAIANSPRQLRNRGLYSIMARSLIGDRRFESLISLVRERLRLRTETGRMSG